MNQELAIGDFVRCSDGTPPPPAHHKKKLRYWECNNFTGWINKIEPGYGIGIDKTGTGVLINIMRFGSYTFTKINPPTEKPQSQLHPRMQPKVTDMSVMTHHKKETSPWGKVDGWSPFGDLGLYHHSTPGHGGIYVPPEMKRQMPKPYRDANGSGNWFEEDCAWSLVALSFPSGLDEKDLESARRSAKDWYPHAYMAVTGETLTAEDSYILEKEQERDSAAHKYVVISAWGSWYEGRSPIPTGMVGCYAVIGGRDDRGHYDESTARYFLIPEEEYKTRSSFGFILHKDYPAWPAAGEEPTTVPTTKRINTEAIAAARNLFAA
jgi:hypothetical protein